MVETIVPVVHGGRRLSYICSVALHSVAAGIAAALVGAVLGAIGFAAGAPWGTGGHLVVAVLAIAYCLREAGVLRVPLPERRAQVPEWWRNFFSPHVSSTLYGFGLGLGYLTHLTFGTYCVVGAVALASGQPLLGAILCAPFGLARGLSVAVAHRTRDEEEIACVIDNIERAGASRWPRTVHVGMLAAIAVAALISS